MRFALFALIPLFLVCCKHRSKLPPPVPGAQPVVRKNCSTPEPFYSLDTVKSLPDYLMYLNARKRTQEHFCYTVISNVNVVDVRSGVTLRSRTVVLHETLIDTILKAGAKLPEFPKHLCVQKVDGKGKYLAPGLCDMHVHYACGARDRLRFLVSGTTTIRSAAGTGLQLHERELLDRQLLIGPNLYFSRSWPFQSATKDSLRPVAPNEFRRWWIYTGAVSDSVYLHNLVNTAAAQGLSLSVDQWRPPAQLPYPDRTVFEKPFGFSRLERLPNASTFWYVLKFASRDDEATSAQALVAPLAAIRANEARFCIGTEAGSTIGRNDFYTMADELKALSKAGISNAAALRMATVNASNMVFATTSAAQTIYPDFRFGEVAHGCQADLVLLRENPLENVEAYRNMAGLFLDGIYFSPYDLLEMRKAIDKF